MTCRCTPDAPLAALQPGRGGQPSPLRPQVSHPAVASYVARSLLHFSPSAVEPLLPQLLQAIRLDPQGQLEAFLAAAARRSVRVAHRLLWLLLAEAEVSTGGTGPLGGDSSAKRHLFDPKYNEAVKGSADATATSPDAAAASAGAGAAEADESADRMHGFQRSASGRDPLPALAWRVYRSVLLSLEPEARALFLAQYGFFDEVTDISRRLKREVTLKNARHAYIKKCLEDVFGLLRKEAMSVTRAVARGQADLSTLRTQPTASEPSLISLSPALGRPLLPSSTKVGGKKLSKQGGAGTGSQLALSAAQGRSGSGSVSELAHELASNGPWPVAVRPTAVLGSLLEIVPRGASKPGDGALALSRASLPLSAPEVAEAIAATAGGTAQAADDQDPRLPGGGALSAAALRSPLLSSAMLASELPSLLYLPTHPTRRVVGIHLHSGRAMQSAARCPFLLRFDTAPYPGGGPDAAPGLIRRRAALRLRLQAAGFATTASGFADEDTPGAWLYRKQRLRVAASKFRGNAAMVAKGVLRRAQRAGTAAKQAVKAVGRSAMRGLSGVAKTIKRARRRDSDEGGVGDDDDGDDAGAPVAEEEEDENDEDEEQGGGELSDASHSTSSFSAASGDDEGPVGFEPSPPLAMGGATDAFGEAPGEAASPGAGFILGGAAPHGSGGSTHRHLRSAPIDSGSTGGRDSPGGWRKALRSLGRRKGDRSRGPSPQSPVPLEPALASPLASPSRKANTLPALASLPEMSGELHSSDSVSSDDSVAEGVGDEAGAATLDSGHSAGVEAGEAASDRSVQGTGQEGVSPQDQEAEGEAGGTGGSAVDQRARAASGSGRSGTGRRLSAEDVAEQGQQKGGGSRSRTSRRRRRRHGHRRRIGRASRGDGRQGPLEAGAVVEDSAVGAQLLAEARLLGLLPGPTPVEPRAVIFKVYDDVRQDMLAVQVMRLLQIGLGALGEGHWLYPYDVLPARVGSERADGGMLEVVPDARSLDDVGKSGYPNLFHYFRQQFGRPDGRRFAAARSRFAESLSANAVLTYLLWAKDRHNGNILIRGDGRICHIDWGFLLGISPGGNLGFEAAPFKMTREMVAILGGDTGTPHYGRFLELTTRALLQAQALAPAIEAAVSSMADSGLPCFHFRDTLQKLRQRLAPELDPLEAAARARCLVEASRTATTTGLYDGLQKLQNDIHSEQWQ